MSLITLHVMLHQNPPLFKAQYRSNPNNTLDGIAFSKPNPSLECIASSKPNASLECITSSKPNTSLESIALQNLMLLQNLHQQFFFGGEP